AIATASRNSRCTVDRFFFSSRRRHTRCYRDWSSDVCSSDLLLLRRADEGAAAAAARGAGQPGQRQEGHPAAEHHPGAAGVAGPRSEERRVGKEGRSRWWAWSEKKKGGRK